MSPRLNKNTDKFVDLNIDKYSIKVKGKWIFFQNIWEEMRYEKKDNKYAGGVYRGYGDYCGCREREGVCGGGDVFRPEGRMRCNSAVWLTLSYNFLQSGQISL